MSLLSGVLLLATSAGPGLGSIERVALLHDSRDPVYRSPQGAVPLGTAVRLRLRCRRGDLTQASAVTWNETDGGRALLPLARVATDGAYDFWEITLPAEPAPALVRYRFVVRRGVEVLFYEDDPPLEGHETDGGTGVALDRSADRGFLITHYLPSFRTPDWLKGAVIYQIFPDRFSNGDPGNDPAPTWPDVHGQPVLRKAWDERPEGACRYYTDWCCPEDPHARDFFGGDLEGVRQKLPYLAGLGVDAIYLNPIFDSPSNHKYDTRDYSRTDPGLGDEALFSRLASEARARGMRLILDGVFNHVSSDSLYFDKRGRHHQTPGAYQSRESPYAAWFTFDPWPDGYTRWFGVDTLPVLTETKQVQEFFFGPGGIARRWLDRGASGWRLDAMEQKSHRFWREMRAAVKDAHPDAPLLGEFWHDAAPWLTGLEMDGVTNYRFRNAVIGFVNGDTVDANGRIAGLPPSRFDAALRAVLEAYPPQAAGTLMNLLDSHDTERILWTLTPGRRRPDEKEDPARLVAGKAKLRLAALLQMTLPGAPTLYSGDEVGLTGDTDPDDRRPFPWGREDLELRAHYRKLIGLRRELSCLRTGAFTTLLADDANGVYAFLRHNALGAALVAVARGDQPAAVAIPVSGVLAPGTRLRDALGGATLAVRGGIVQIALPAQAGVVLVAPASAVRLPRTRPERPRGWKALAPAPRAPEPRQDPSLPRVGGLSVAGASQAELTLEWRAAPDAAGYDVLRREECEATPRLLVRLGATRCRDGEVLRGRRYAYSVRVVGSRGAVGPASAEVSAVAEPQTIRVTLRVTAPDPGEARVHVTGGFQGWVAAATPMQRAGPGQWTHTLEAHEGERLEYKYTLGSWERVEKAADLAEPPNRVLVVTPGAQGAQTVEDRVARWRDTDPCGRR